MLRAIKIGDVKRNEVEIVRHFEYLVLSDDIHEIPNINQLIDDYDESLPKYAIPILPKQDP